MGVVKLFSHLLAAWVAFLHPCFASYKALSHRPVSEPDLERWVKYWAVLAALTGAEYALEWLVSWVPFYWEIKTIFILYLALPQTQGSTFIYDSYLAPYFSRNEASIDAGIATAQSNMLIFIRERLQALWNFVWNLVTQTQAAQASQPGGQQPPAGSPADVVSNLWRTYGASVVSGITRAASGQNPVAPAPQNSGSSQNVTPQGSAASTPAAQPYTRSPFSATGAE